MANATLPERARAVLDFWFGPGYEGAPLSFAVKDRAAVWFKGGAEVDQYITEQFSTDLKAAAAGQYDSWLTGGPLSGLAGIILMDQLSRHIHRGTPGAFATDPKALQWSENIVNSGGDASLPLMLRYFAYMPYVHADDLAMQEKGVGLFRAATAAAEAAPGGEEAARLLRSQLAYAEAHRDIVARWGRFPHRNVVLGRPSTADEVAGLADGSIRTF